MSRWREYNPNPQLNIVGDCTVRAIAKATGQTWRRTFRDLCDVGDGMCDMPSSNRVWRQYLYDLGFVRHLIDDHGKAEYTVEDFCRDNPEGTFVLAIPGHVVCVSDGLYWDTWDSGEEIPEYYWERT